MRAQQSVLFNGISATTAAFNLNGGRYLAAVTATFGGGTVALQVLGADGATWIGVTGGSFTAAGTLAVDLGAGSYQWLVTTATAVLVTLVQVPTD
jgi:hypothetical protein